MKKFFLLIINIVLITVAFAQKNTEAILDSAFNAYMNKDYDIAAKLYNEILDKNYSSADLYYNLANCYMQNDNIANAIYYYEKAKALNPNDNNINYNLRIANARKKDKVENLPIVFYKLWFISIMNLTPTNTWAIVAVVNFVMLLLLIFFFLFSNSSKIKKVCFFLAILFIVIFISALIFSIKSAKSIQENKYAIVFNSSMVKSSPSNDARNLFEINEGLKIEITDSLNSFYQIKLSDGKEGWITNESVKKL